MRYWEIWDLACLFVKKKKEFTFPFVRNHLALLLPCLDVVQPPQPDLGETESPRVFTDPPVGMASLVGRQANRGQTIQTVLDSSDSSGIFMGPVGQPLPAASQADRQGHPWQVDHKLTDMLLEVKLSTIYWTYQSVRGSIWGQFVNPASIITSL